MLNVFIRARIVRILENGSNSIKGKLSQGDTITCVGLSRDCRLVVTGSKDALKAWDASSGFITQVLVGHAAAVTCCAVSAEGGRILSGDASGTVIAWDIETGNAMNSFSEHSKEVTSVAITMDGSVGLSGKLSQFNFHFLKTSVIMF